MSCPLNRNRWKGSGYEKKGPECSTSLDNQMEQMMAAREAMDKAVSMPHPVFTTGPTPIGPPKPQPMPSMFQVAQQASKAVAQFVPKPRPAQQQQQSINIPMDADAMLAMGKTNVLPHRYEGSYISAEQVLPNMHDLPCSLCVCKDFFPDRGNRTLCVGCRHPYNNHHPVRPISGPPVPPGPPALTRTTVRGPPTPKNDLKVPTPVQKQNHGTYHRY